MPQGSVNDFEGAHIPHLDPIIPAEPLETTNMVAAPIVRNNTCLPRCAAHVLLPVEEEVVVYRLRVHKYQ